MVRRSLLGSVCAVLVFGAVSACGDDTVNNGPLRDDEGGGEGAGDGGEGAADGSEGTADGSEGTADGSEGTADGGDDMPTNPGDGPGPGNPDGSCNVPAEARPVDTSNPARVVGTGTPESCTSAALVEAVAQGGIITFDCGPDPVTIAMDATAKVFNKRGNDNVTDVVLDGGGKVTLSGQNQRRILYQNTCDEAQVFATPRCDVQDFPRLVVQNLTFIDGNAQGETQGGGGAIYAQGGTLKIINSRFFHNQADKEGQDVGGGAVRAFMQVGPVYVVNSTFGGPDVALGNEAANGGGLSSIGVSWTVINSSFENNRAVGEGGNPAKPNTVGGGSGGAIYNDGNEFTLTLCGTRIASNHGNEYGGAIFFVSNNRTGRMIIDQCTLQNNVSEDAAADQYPGIFVLQNGEPTITNSIVE